MVDLLDGDKLVPLSRWSSSRISNRKVNICIILCLNPSIFFDLFVVSASFDEFNLSLLLFLQRTDHGSIYRKVR